MKERLTFRKTKWCALLAVAALGYLLYPENNTSTRETKPTHKSDRTQKALLPAEVIQDKKHYDSKIDTKNITEPPQSAADTDYAALIENTESRINRLEDNMSKLIKFLILNNDDELLTAEEKRTLKQLIAQSPESALLWAKKQESGEDFGRLYTAVVAAWTVKDFDTAWKWACSQSDETAALLVLSSTTAPTDVAGIGADWVEQNPQDNLVRYSFLSRIWRELEHNEAILVLADGLDPALRDTVFQSALSNFSQVNPQKALSYAIQRTGEHEREVAEVAVVSGWPKSQYNDLRNILPQLKYDRAKAVAKEKLNIGIPPLLAR